MLDVEREDGNLKVQIVNKVLILVVVSLKNGQGPNPPI